LYIRRRHRGEQGDRLLEVALGVVPAPEQVVKLVADLLQRRLLELGALVLSDLLQDAGGLGQLAAEGGEPLQRRGVVTVGIALLHDTVEVGQRRRVELEVVEGLAHPELGSLLVRLAVAGLALDHLVQLDARAVVVARLVELERLLQRLRRRPALLNRLGLEGEVRAALLLGQHSRRREKEGKGAGKDAPIHSFPRA
jgi:hypothetical protein